MGGPYYVSHSGDNSDGLSFTNAYHTLAQAIADASTDGDIIKVDEAHTGDQTSGDVTYTPLADIIIISVETTGETPSSMDQTSTWIGDSTGSNDQIWAGAHRVKLDGLALRVNTGRPWFNSSSGHYEVNNCHIRSSSTSFNLISGNTTNSNYTKFTNCTFYPTNTASVFLTIGHVEFDNCDYDAASAAVTDLIGAWSEGAFITYQGCDFTELSTSLNLMTNQTESTMVDFINCKLPSSFTAMDAQTQEGKAGGKVRIFDSDVGDEHTTMEYHDGFGSIVPERTIKATGEAAGQSWKVTTTANCSQYTPFVTPWIDMYHDGTSAITPYFECLRNLDATKYTDIEVWAEFEIKETASSTKTTLSSDRDTVLGTGTVQADGTGASFWEGENGTAAFFKCDSDGTRTPAEAGHIRGRIVVGKASVSDLYIDPQIRT